MSTATAAEAMFNRLPEVLRQHHRQQHKDQRQQHRHCIELPGASAPVDPSGPTFCALEPALPLSPTQLPPQVIYWLTLTFCQMMSLRGATEDSPGDAAILATMAEFGVPLRRHVWHTATWAFAKAGDVDASLAAFAEMQRTVDNSRKAGQNLLSATKALAEAYTKAGDAANAANSAQQVAEI